MPALTPNAPGLTKRRKCAYSQPDSPASSAAYRNTRSFSAAVLTPKLSAMTLRKRSARIARPERESSRLCAAISAASVTTQIST